LPGESERSGEKTPGGNHLLSHALACWMVSYGIFSVSLESGCN